MSEHEARQLAQTLCDTTELVLLPIIPAWARRHGGECWKTGRQPRPILRVGGGRATHHRFDFGSGEHRITFGVKMVADKLVPEACGSWLSTREILGRGYFQGQVSVANLLAHTGCHEFAHFLQTVSGGRRRGSVHNAAFYRILDDLHGIGVADSFRQALLDLARNRGQVLATDSVTMPDPKSRLARFQPGDLVCFGRDNTLEGRVTRINRKTCSVQGTGPCRGSRYRVSPQVLVHRDVD
jgi:hypothetical protein